MVRLHFLKRIATLKPYLFSSENHKMNLVQNAPLSTCCISSNISEFESQTYVLTSHSGSASQIVTSSLLCKHLADRKLGFRWTIYTSDFNSSFPLSVSAARLYTQCLKIIENWTRVKFISTFEKFYGTLEFLLGPLQHLNQWPTGSPCKWT